MKDIFGIIGIVLGFLGAVIGVIAMRITIYLILILGVLQFIELIQIGWLMVFLYPLLLFICGLFLYFLNIIFIALVLSK